MLHFNSFDDINAIIEVAIKLNLPKTINFYGTEYTFRDAHKFLKPLSKKSTEWVDLNKDGEYPVFADVFIYAGFTFNLIHVDKTIDLISSKI